MRALLLTVLLLVLTGCASTGQRASTSRQAPPSPETGTTIPGPRGFEHAVELFDAGDFASAEKLLLEMRQQEPERPEVADYLGRVYFEQTRYADSVAQLEAAVALDDTNVDSHLWLGRALSEHVHEALFFRKLPIAKQIQATFRRAVELDPESIEGQTALARFYSEAPAFAGGDREKSLQHAQELIRLDPVEGHQVLASIYELFKEPALAEQELLRAIEAVEAQRDQEGAEESLADLRKRLDALQNAPQDDASATPIE